LDVFLTFFVIFSICNNLLHGYVHIHETPESESQKIPEEKNATADKPETFFVVSVKIKQKEPMIR